MKIIDNIKGIKNKKALERKQRKVLNTYIEAYKKQILYCDLNNVNMIYNNLFENIEKVNNDETLPFEQTDKLFRDAIASYENCRNAIIKQVYEEYISGKDATEK